jgi:hypothetical protein
MGLNLTKNSPMKLKTNLNLVTIPSETVNEEASDQIINEVLPIISEEDYINLLNGKKNKANNS